MCGLPLTGRKRRWCGKRECFQKVFIRAGDQTAMRRWLKERQHEVCQICKTDCSDTKWEAHHIIPLSEGGQHHEDNIQTLCIQCHRAETKALAKRRGKTIQLKMF